MIEKFMFFAIIYYINLYKYIFFNILNCIFLYI